MRDQLEKRLELLQSELLEGQRIEAELERRKEELKERMLRISGAIQVLEEELAQDGTESEGTGHLDGRDGVSAEEDQVTRVAGLG